MFRKPVLQAGMVAREPRRHARFPIRPWPPLPDARKIPENLAHHARICGKFALIPHSGDFQRIRGKRERGAMHRVGERSQMAHRWAGAWSQRAVQFTPANRAVGNDGRAGRLREIHCHFEIGRELKQLELTTILAASKNAIGQRNQRVSFLKRFDPGQHLGHAVIGQSGEILA